MLKIRKIKRVSLSTIPSYYVIGSRRVIELRVASGKPSSPRNDRAIIERFRTNVRGTTWFVGLFYLQVNLFVREIIDSFVD